MINNAKIGSFLFDKRREMGLTQGQLAQRLNVSFQAVSKWEQGVAAPSLDALVELSRIFEVTVDELLAGAHKGPSLSYSKAGVDVTYTDSIKKAMTSYIAPNDLRSLNGLGAFASLYDISFPDIPNPVLVLKAEEPGSKQKLAVEYGYTESICFDMINHLVNDIIVMGARPLAVLDTIVCSNAEKDTITALVKGISKACMENECSLVGGETSIQPNVVSSGLYILTSSIAGIVNRDNIIDGSAILEGDCLLAISSNGLHTNGYSLVRLLMDRQPKIKLDRIENLTFIEEIMKPHTPYYKAVKGLFPLSVLKGMAHITGGGIGANISRIIPDGLCANIDLSKIRTLPIFEYIKNQGSVQDSEMLSTFNCGVGMILAARAEDKAVVMSHINNFYPCYEIGTVTRGCDKVAFESKLAW